MKFLFVIKRPLSHFDFARFGFAYLSGAGHSISVLDVSEVFHPGLDNRASDLSAHPAISRYLVADSEALDGCSSSVSGADIVVLMTHSVHVTQGDYRLLKLCRSAGAPYMFLQPGLYPGWNFRRVRRSLAERVVDFSKRLRTFSPASSLWSRLPRVAKLPAARFVVRSGLENDSIVDPLIGPETALIPGHSHDYDRYLRCKAHADEPLDQAVFLDQYLPYHPDAKAVRVSGHVDPIIYYARLRDLFTRVEQALGIPVVISAHPRADYSDKLGVFGNRDLHTGRTDELIARSRFVIGHISTALGLAVAMRRPIMLVASKDVLNLHFNHRYIYRLYAEELGIPLRFLDGQGEVDISGVEHINIHLYSKFIDRYMKYPGSPDDSLWEIIERAIMSATASQLTQVPA